MIRCTARYVNARSSGNLAGGVRKNSVRMPVGSELLGGVFPVTKMRPRVTANNPQIMNFVTEISHGNNGLEASKNDLEKARLFWIEVNDVTWKLTDGEISRTPASFGQWGGYNTERAVAWVIDVGWPFGKGCWYARRGDNSYGPTSLSDAKRAAESFLSGTPVPEYKGAHSFIGAINLNAGAIRTAPSIVPDEETSFGANTSVANQ